MKLGGQDISNMDIEKLKKILTTFVILMLTGVIDVTNSTKVVVILICIPIMVIQLIKFIKNNGNKYDIIIYIATLLASILAVIGISMDKVCYNVNLIERVKPFLMFGASQVFLVITIIWFKKNRKEERDLYFWVVAVSGIILVGFFFFAISLKIINDLTLQEIVVASSFTNSQKVYYIIKIDNKLIKELEDRSFLTLLTIYRKK